MNPVRRILDGLLDRIRWLKDFISGSALRLAAEEVRISALIAREEVFAAAEEQAAELEAAGQPKLAQAIRAEIARLRVEDPAATEGAPAQAACSSPKLSSAAAQATALPEAPTDGKFVPRRGAKRALPPSPPAADPYAPPAPPWSK